MGYEGRFVCGDPGGVRTRDLSLRRRTLSSTELRGQMVYKRVHKRSRTCTKHVHGTAHISMVISVPCAAGDMAQLRVNFLLIISYENEETQYAHVPLRCMRGAQPRHGSARLWVLGVHPLRAFLLLVESICMPYSYYVI